MTSKYHFGIFYSVISTSVSHCGFVRNKLCASLGYRNWNIKRLILGCSPPLWDNRPDSLIMAWGPEARRTLLGWKADYLIMAASNQVINVFNTNALQSPNMYLKQFKNSHNSKSINIRILYSWEFNRHTWRHLLNYVNKNKSLT